MSEKKYSKEHEWIEVNKDVATIGITNHAQESLGDIVFIELPTIGKKVVSHEEVCVIESVKAASDIYAPIDGEIIEVNNLLRGFFVPDGKNDITLEFRPKDLVYSSILTYASLILILIMFIASFIDRKNEKH